MALAEVAIPIGFSGGVDTKTDSKSVATTKLTALENGVFDKNTTIIKRTGYTALSKAVDGAVVDGAAYAVPSALAARGDELVLLADDKLLSYRESSSTWSLVGRAQSIEHTERVIAATGTDQSMPDAASLDGVTALAWEDSRGGVWWAVVELASGRMLRPAEQLDANGQRPRVCACGPVLHVYYAVPAAERIYVVVVNPSSYLTAPVPAILVGTLNSTNPAYDAKPIEPEGGGGGVVMAWALATGGHQIAFIDASGVIGSAVTGWPSSIAWAADGITGPLAIVDCSDCVAVLYAATTTVRARIVTRADLSVSMLGATVLTGPASNIVRIAATIAGDSESVLTASDTDIWIWGEETNSNDRDHRVWYAMVNQTGVNPQGALPLRGHGLVSRGFRDDDNPYVIVTHDVPFFPYAAVLRGFHSDLNVSEQPEMVAVGRLVVGSSDGLPTRQHVSSVETDEDDERVHRWSALAREQVNAEPSGAQFAETSIRRVSLDFDSANAFQSTEFGADLVIAGAMPLRYDGDTVAELGFHCAPDGTITATPSAIGDLLQVASYLYWIAYEEVDAAGLIHPGPMSAGTLVALAEGEHGVTLVIPTYRLTSKRRVRIGVFRSEGNDTSGDSPALYRVTSLDPTATGTNGYLLNDTTVDTVTFVDGLSDANLLLRERAYTNEGVLSNDPIGLGCIVVAGKDRLFFSDPTDPNVVRFTQTRRDGYGAEVAADLSLRVDQASGGLGALGILDDALVILMERGIYFATGPGPLANPDAAPQIGFSSPQQIPSDVGCVTPRSMAITSERIMFQAADNRGIYAVNRAREVKYIGADVEAYNSLAVVSADSIPAKHQTVFLTASGRTLLWDDYHGQWSTFTNHAGIDAVVVGGLYHYLRASSADYRVFRSSSGYLDGGLPILLYLETAWIKLAGYHQGLQKIWYALLLGKWMSSHVLEVRIATDYRDGWPAPFYIEVDASHTPAPYGDGLYGAGVYGGADDSVYEQRIHVGQKCKSIRFGIGETMGGEFSQAPPVGASFELTELLLTGGAMRPSATVASGRTQ